MAMDKDLKTLGAFALGLVSLAIISVLGIIILTEFKSVGTSTTTSNSTIDLFVAGIAVFGTFAGVMALVLVAKIMVKLIKNY